MVAYSQRQGILSGVRIEPMQTPHAMLVQGGEGRVVSSRWRMSIQRAVKHNNAFFWLWLQGFHGQNSDHECESCGHGLLKALA